MREIARAENLTVNYGGENVLDNISFSIGKGDFVAVMGPNGSGKTTLIKTLLGLEPISGGDAYLFGVPVGEFSGWASVGYLPQAKGAVYGNFPITAREAVEMGLVASKKIPRFMTKADAVLVDAALESVGLSDEADSLIGEISGGQQQRVFLARALVNSPSLLVLDEPGAALDPKSRAGFYELLSRLNAEKKTTIILVTHDMAEAGRYAARLMLVDSQLVFHGTREQFCHSATVEKYFGPFAQHLICHRHEKCGGGGTCPL